MIRSALARLPTQYAASSSRVAARAFASSARRTNAHSDLVKQLEEQLTPREAVERKRKEMEAKYGDKLTKRVKEEGVSNLDALKERVVAPSVLAKIKAKKYREEEAAKAEKARQEEEAQRAAASAAKAEATTEKRDAARKSQAEGDRSGVKPLSSIINLPLILMTPHDAAAIGDIWNTYHRTHTTLAPSFLSASMPLGTYESILTLAKENPFFVLPLPRGKDGGESSFEMFYVQWLFHPSPSAPPTADPKADAPLPPVTSAIFTPLEEFKSAGEWAQPFLTLTFYPDLANTHGTVLLRGEITPVSAAGPAGSAENPGFLLSQQEAQLLDLALQRFYCAGLGPANEDLVQREERLKRGQALRDFREKPQEWDWQGLIQMAYGGLA
ncbi:hypothetical protein Q8F55_007107 [Vanrija albida]|uniref:ATP synthase mitochondrial F1 complex assembly factor 1 n=1 Tax=Vanrija albida TaxID=181172 RepID=A0ABR3PYY9_9TREE